MAPDRRVIRVFPDADAASRAAAEAVAGRARAAVRRKGAFTLALAGGGTPRRLYELLATVHRQQVPWDGLRVLWGDERCVPPDDPRSNYAMAREALLDRVPVRPDAVHRIRGELGPEAGAADYHDVVAGIPDLDLALLGVGADGHTASLFPGQVDPDDRRWAQGVRAPPGVEPPDRVTLTLRALNAFSEAIFLVTGQEKRAVVEAARTAQAGGPGPDAMPALRVRPATAPLWIVDRAASGR